jgi:hypothetical protein
LQGDELRFTGGRCCPVLANVAVKDEALTERTRLAFVDPGDGP